MRSQLAAPPVSPQILHLPDGAANHDAADEALEWLRVAGETLDPAQEFVVRHALAERTGGGWAAFEVCDIEPRQNGKGAKIQAREAVGLFLLGEQLQIHTAHEFATANEAFLRMVGFIEANPELRKRVARIRYANGEQGIELHSGARLKYRARTGGAGRGFAGADLVVLDEAFNLTAEHMAALLPTLSTSVNPQVWFASSAGLSTSTMLWALRKRALRGSAGRLAYFERTAEDVSIDDFGRVVSKPIDVADRSVWAAVNVGLGTRITMETVEAQYDSLPAEIFARERLGVFDPLAGESIIEPKLPQPEWRASVVPHARAPRPKPGELTLAFDVAPNSEFASIAMACGTLGATYVELIEHLPHVGWLPDRLVELVQRWRPIAVGYNDKGATQAAAAPVLVALRDAGIDVALVHNFGAPDYQAACGGFYADVAEGRLTRPTGQPFLDAAGEVAPERPMGEGWVWDARKANAPISPLVAATVARALLPTEVATAKPTFAY